MSALIETWNINQKMNELLIVGLPEAHLADVSEAKGRTVGEQLAHIHNVRLMWLKVAAPELLYGQVKIEKEDQITKKLLFNRLEESSKAIAKLLEEGIATGKIKGFKPHPEGFLGYMIAHESHHRGQAILVLKLNKHLPDKKTLYGLWEWGTKT